MEIRFIGLGGGPEEAFGDSIVQEEELQSCNKMVRGPWT